MPNHVTNEIIFRDVDLATQEKILVSVCGADGKVNFETLVPLPVNMWWGNVGSDHEKTFKRTALDWCRENWGTKWNAYKHREIARTESTLTLVFDTAWSPPYPWLAAVFNTLKLGFEHNWFDEGQGFGHHAVFDWNAFENDDFGRRDWFEERASDELFKHLHVLKYGCESFPDEDE